MAVKSSGIIGLSAIESEFGINPNYRGLSNYYRGGPLVPNGPIQNNNIPTSGLIKISDFYGAVKAVSLICYVFTTVTNLNLKNLAIQNGWDGVTPINLTVIVTSDAIIGASDVGSYALDTGSNYPPSSTIRLINYGYIVGHGGNGGDGGINGTITGQAMGGSDGGNGGNSLLINSPITIGNYSVIGGGGGGGGGGASSTSFETPYYCGGGGGGGAGFYGGLGGDGGTTATENGASPSESGLTGTLLEFGTGGQGSTNDIGNKSGNGGNGGFLGSAGGNGAESYELGNFYRPGGIGGNPGYAVVGNGYVTWENIGNLYGPIA